MTIYVNISVAANITPYKLTGVDGKVAIRHFSDEQNFTRTSIEGENSSDIQEIEIDVQTHSYIYHPNLVTLHMGGGPVIIRNAQKSSDSSDFTGDSQSFEEDITDITYNFNTKLNFLEKKTYPFSLFYERRNPLVVSGFGEHFIQKNTKYGTSATWRDFSKPVSLNFEAQNLTSNGESNNLVINDEFTNAQVSISQNNKKTGHRQLTLQTSRSVSSSGTTGPTALPIVSSEIQTQSIHYDDYSIFGSGTEYTLRNIFSSINRNFVRDVEPSSIKLRQLHFAPDFRWNHSKSQQSYYQLDYFDSSQNEVKTENRTINIGYTKQHDIYGSNNANVILLNNDTTGFNLKSYGIFGSTNFLKTFGEPDFVDLTKPDPTTVGATRKLTLEQEEKLKAKRVRELSTGRAKFQVRLGYQVFDRSADNAGDDILVQNESHALTGTENVKLNNELINVTSIEVFNTNKSQTYIEGIDYAIIVIGNDTFIRRLLGGNIVDNETVLVDYTYELGGTFSYTSLDQQYQVSLDLYKKLNLLAGLIFKNIDITSGTPGIALSSIENRTIGISFDTPVTDSVSAGISYRIDDEVKSVNPNKRESTSAYVQFGLFNSTFVRLTSQFLTVEYEENLEDVDLKRFHVRLTSRPFRRSTLLLSAISEKDDGGTYPRKLTDADLKWQWNFRQIFLTFEVRHNTESQTTNNTDVTQDRNIIRLTVERSF